LRYHLALREAHARWGAQFGERSGWSLPKDYGAPGLEYERLRTGAATSDESYRTRFLVTGTDANEVLGSICAGRADELEEGRAARTVILDGNGEIQDLLLVARTGAIAYLVIGAPAVRDRTLARLQEGIGLQFDCRVDDRTETTCQVSILGPGASAAVDGVVADGLAARLPPMHADAFEFHGFRALVVRAGEYGEDGFTFVTAPAVGLHLLESLREAGVGLCGYAASEAARIESAIPAYDPDLVPGLSPAEADLDLLMDIPGGRERWALTSVLLDGDRAPATGTPLSSGGVRCGELRSVAMCPAVRGVAGLAIVDSRLALPGRELDAAGQRATIVAKPIYRRRRTA
jgi:glycine cleavage system aminomethyltransferase T